MIKSSISRIKKNPYKFFLLKLVVLFVIIFIFDYSVGNILRYFYFKQESGMPYRTTYSIEKTTADILIFGSSRANHHYHPDVFEKRLNLSYYNVGRDGNYVFYDYAILKGVLKRYSPKIVILDFVIDEFQLNQNSYDRISVVLPYYRTHPEIRPIIELRSTYEKFKSLSSIYPFNSLVLTIAFSNAGFYKKRKEDINGFVPLTKTWNGVIQIDTSSVKFKLDNTKVKVYEAFIQDCISLKVKLYVVCSPYYIKSNHTNYSVLLGQEIAKRYNVMFIDYSKDSIFNFNSKLFADIGHLNEEGAKNFSNMLIDSISKSIENKVKK